MAPPGAPAARIGADRALAQRLGRRACLRKFAGDLVAHMHLENEVLFPRFERPAAA
ncbi:Nitric oxide-dependent regulator DnrN or NorA [Rhodobacter sp. AKP1]|nr:Nitric oxide-dependent regulator DnrN or NorA [Rhodobacter sp. AKP1]